MYEPIRRFMFGVLLKLIISKIYKDSMEIIIYSESCQLCGNKFSFILPTHIESLVFGVHGHGEYE